jgi:hypothetical protein
LDLQAVFLGLGTTNPFNGLNVFSLAKTISETGISKLLAAVRKQVKEPKYQAK